MTLGRMTIRNAAKWLLALALAILFNGLLISKVVSDITRDTLEGIDGVHRKLGELEMSAPDHPLVLTNTGPIITRYRQRVMLSNTKLAWQRFARYQISGGSLLAFSALSLHLAVWLKKSRQLGVGP